MHGREEKIRLAREHLSDERIRAFLRATQLQVLFGSFLPGDLLKPKFRRLAHASCRNRTYTPTVTFWAFLSQVLDPASFYVKAVAKCHAQMLEDIANDVVQPRPVRYEPRLVKGRRDSYSLLTRPRAEMRKVPAPPKHRLKAA